VSVPLQTSTSTTRSQFRAEHASRPTTRRERGSSQTLVRHISFAQSTAPTSPGSDAPLEVVTQRWNLIRESGIVSNISSSTPCQGDDDDTQRASHFAPRHTTLCADPPGGPFVDQWMSKHRRRSQCRRYRKDHRKRTTPIFQCEAAKRT